jgi:hypothetical protein
MEDAAYFRARARMCREIARQLSSNVDAQRMRDEAAAHTARAEALEAQADAATTMAAQPRPKD